MSGPVALHAEVSGPPGAPLVVLLGSLGSTTAMWDPQVGALSERCRVVRVDLRGHGSSPVPEGPYAVADLGRDVLALLERPGLGADRAHLAGLSLGGMVATWVAAHAPERVGRLALLCTSAHLPPAEAWRERAATVRERGTEAVADAVVARWFTPALAERDPDLVARHRAMILATPAAGYAACCEAIAAMDQRDDLARIAAPTLVVAGAEDPATPPEHAAALAAGVPGAELVVLERAAHLANVEQAGAVTQMLLAHFVGEDEGRRFAGLRVRRAVLGDAHVDAALAGATEFTAAFQDYITRTAWGDVWARPGLDRRTRSCVTLAVLTALGAEHELALHVRGARRNGLSPEEIAEVLLHTAVYAGVPRANRAFAIARSVLAEMAEDGA